MNDLHKMNMDNSETDCCPKFEPDAWNEKTFKIKDLLFVKAKTRSFLYIPLNMNSVMTKTMAKINDEQAAPTDTYLTLSYDVSPWHCDHYFLVTKPVSKMEMANLDGTYMTKVFEGDFKDIPNWMKEMKSYVEKENKAIKAIYNFYTTCPKCAKHYGYNYVVLFAKI